MKSNITKLANIVAAVAIVVGALGMTAPSANAQGPSLPGLGGPSSLSVGAFFPNSHDAKDRGGSTQISADFRYHVPVPNPLDVPARTVVDLGVQTGAKDGKHSTIIPITIGEVVGTSKQSPLSAGSVYVGAGVGAYILNQSGISTATRLGGYVNAGYNVNASTFIDAKYQFVDHGSGPAVNVGFRF